MKVLYITPFVPYKEIPHAGGFFLYNYLMCLSRYIDIQIVAPRTEENEYATAKSKEWLNVVLIGEKSVIRSKWVRLFPLLWNSFVNPIEFPRKQLSAISEYLKHSGILHEVDMVELQFSQTLALIKRIKQYKPDLPVVVFEHDVYSQSVLRRVQGAPFSPNKILNVLKLFRVRSIETSLINRCDGAFVFSDKDKTLLQKMEIQTPIEVLLPSIDLPKRAASLNGKPICLFVGAMNRSENYEAATWFISNIWPKVLEQIPEAKLNIVGANPPADLINLSNGNVTITGFVDKIDPYYEEASLCIAPLLTGAGVKFKVLQAMAYGLPVVTTPVGVEGIAENESRTLFPYITADINQFAEGVIQFLTNESLRKQNGFSLRKWIEDNYNFDKNTVLRALLFYDSLSLSKEV